MLIHNPGAIHRQFRTDGSGTELTILGQVVAPFLLTRLLVPALLRWPRREAMRTTLRSPGRPAGSAISRPPRSRAASCGNDTPIII